jgi:hypothetical protein
MSDFSQLRKEVDDIYSTIIKNGNINVITREEFDAFRRLILGNYADSSDISIVTNSLTRLSTDLTDFGTQLDDYGDTLRDFKLELDGDEDTKGFMDYLDELRTNIYGYGGTYVDPETGETKPYDINHPSSSSLKGMLIDFQSQLEHIISGVQQLSINLGQLKNYLTGFSGTLAQFKTYLTQQGIDVSELNDGLLQLIFKLNTSIEQIDSHEQDLKDFDGLIGKSTDSASSQESQGKKVTIYGIINDTSDTVGDEHSGLI